MIHVDHWKQAVECYPNLEGWELDLPVKEGTWDLWREKQRTALIKNKVSVPGPQSVG